MVIMVDIHLEAHIQKESETQYAKRKASSKNETKLVVGLSPAHGTLLLTPCPHPMTALHDMCPHPWNAPLHQLPAGLRWRFFRNPPNQILCRLVPRISHPPVFLSTSKNKSCLVFA
jgi:hypothetical protein